MTDPTTKQSSIDLQILGTGGIPNLRVIQDFATTPPTLSFELHTQIHLPDATPSEVSTAMNAQPFPQQLVQFIITRGTIRADLKGPLQALLMQLYKV